MSDDEIDGLEVIYIHVTLEERRAGIKVHNTFFYVSHKRCGYGCDHGRVTIDGLSG